MRFRVGQLVDDLDGDLVVPSGLSDPTGALVDGVGIDSRTIAAGALFVAVHDQRDGHDFVQAAAEAGAAAALVDHPIEGVISLVVSDPQASLTRMGSLARARLPERVVGITGSVGKTTTKDLLASALRQRFVTAASERSFNNELGVPITLANAPAGTEVAVIEMGSRGRGHIADLCAVARPTVGIVTAVAAVHTETLGGIEGVAIAKRELVEALPADGLAVLNDDDPRVASMADHTTAEILSFGGTGDVRATGISLDESLIPTFTLDSPWGSVPVRLGVRGLHNVANALAAAAAALWLEVDLDDVVAGLARPVPSPWRMELSRGRTGVLVLNDAYNAGPASMAAALRSLAALPARRRVAVLGVMAELGESEHDEHDRIATLAQDLQIEVIAVGTDLYGSEAMPAADGATDDVDTIDVTAVIEAVGPIDSDVAVLVKGSRVAGLEVIAAALLD